MWWNIRNRVHFEGGRYSLRNAFEFSQPEIFFESLSIILNVLTRRYLESIFSFIHFVISLFALFSRVWGVLAPFDGYCIEIHFSSRKSSKNSRNDRSFPRGSIWSSVCPCTKANPATRILNSFIFAQLKTWKILLFENYLLAKVVMLV